MASYDNAGNAPSKDAVAAHHVRPANSEEYEMDSQDYHESIQGHTRRDRADMTRMGKIQELRRNYRPLSALAFTVILQGVWEVLMT